MSATDSPPVLPVPCRVSLVIALLLAGCAATSTSKRSTSPGEIALRPDDIGRVPDGFSTALTGGGGPGAWVVRDDADHPGTPVLVQESRDDTSYRFPLCVYDRFTARDVAVSVRFKTIAGDTDQAAGIVLRYSPENYYVARANALEDNVSVFKTVNGKREKLLEIDTKVTRGI